MKRRLFNLLAAVSLVMCVATMLLWVRSYRWSEGLEWGYAIEASAVTSASSFSGVESNHSLRSHRGLLRYELDEKHHDARNTFPGESLPLTWRHEDAAFSARVDYVPPNGNVPTRPGAQRTHDGLNFGSFGIGIFEIHPWGRPPMFLRQTHYLRLPHWFLVLLFAAPPTVWLYLLLKARVRPKCGRCTACGYNLTGNVSGTCPECGTAVVAGAELNRKT